jgi:methanogenic corrinoid protein MtbC1
MRVYRPQASVAPFRPIAWVGSRRRLGQSRRAPALPGQASDPAPGSINIRRLRVVARARRIKGQRRGIDFRRFWFHLLRRNYCAAHAQLTDLLRCYRPQQLYLRLFVPTLTLSGTMFQLGRITYHDEHFITNACLKLMRRVRHEMTSLSPNGLTALATGVGQDSHRIGLRMVSDLLASTGWHVRDLDTNERGTLRLALAGKRTDALLISIGRSSEFENARRMIAEARRAGFSGVVAVGGRAVAENPDCLTLIGADMTAANGLDLARQLTTLCRRRNLELTAARATA